MSTKTRVDETGNPVAEVVNEAPAEPKAPKALTGEVVCDKPKLNVREKPNMQGKILCTIPVGTKVKIDSASSTKEWYKVRTAKGVDGFCMKKYIATK